MCEMGRSHPPSADVRDRRYLRLQRAPACPEHRRLGCSPTSSVAGCEQMLLSVKGIRLGPDIMSRNSPLHCSSELDTVPLSVVRIGTSWWAVDACRGRSHHLGSVGGLGPGALLGDAVIRPIGSFCMMSSSPLVGLIRSSRGVPGAPGEVRPGRTGRFLAAWSRRPRMSVGSESAWARSASRTGGVAARSRARAVEPGDDGGRNAELRWVRPCAPPDR